MVELLPAHTSQQRGTFAESLRQENLWKAYHDHPEHDAQVSLGRQTIYIQACAIQFDRK